VSIQVEEQDYIPGTQVIRNLIDRDAAHPYGTTDQRYLDLAETMFVSDRIDQLRAEPTSGPFTFARMREIHHHLFQDVYAWAGEPRKAAMSKLGTHYAEPSEMNALLRRQYTSLAEQHYLQNIPDQSEFAARLAGFWAEINHGHAFREGNTRSQTVFFEQLAHEAGWKLDVARLSPHHPLSVYRDFVEARFEHQRMRGSQAPGSTHASKNLAAVLHKLLEPDVSPEGQLRRGEHVSIEREASTAGSAADDLKEHYSRFPELRGVTAASRSQDESARGAGDDFER